MDPSQPLRTSASRTAGSNLLTNFGFAFKDTPINEALVSDLASGGRGRGRFFTTVDLEWSSVFGDPKMTTALLERLTHHCDIEPVPAVCADR